MVWWAEWGDKVAFLQAMARRGHPVPALLNRPDVPDYLQDVLTCYTDLVREGEIAWVDFIRWADEYGLQDREYAWEVINNARQVVDKWHSSKAPSQRPGQPTGPAPNR